MKSRKSTDKYFGQSPYFDYYVESRRPVVSLAFVAPMLLVYEMGMLTFGPQAMRNGADIWLRLFLDGIGFGQYFVLPILTVFTLLGWQHITREPWLFSPRVVPGMLLESLGFSVVLLILVQFQGKLMDMSGIALAMSEEAGVTSHPTTRLIGYFGAGIYEELLFRLLLLPLSTRIARTLGATPRISLLAGILVTSLLFSAAHYRVFTSAGEVFDWFSFSFRFLAGIFFAILFTFRGFGITVGAHTLYDILAASIYTLSLRSAL